MLKLIFIRRISYCFLTLIFIAGSIFAQTTEFTYQGRLLSGSLPANGNHDFEFRLFADASGNMQVGSAITLTNVNVNNGVFSVRLDFGNQFPGANRFLGIRVRQSGQEFFTVLTPRQSITSAPYSIKSLNAENAINSTNALLLNGLPANQFVLTGDGRLSDARNPLPNSPNYIQNRTTQQTLSNFNIRGNGTVGGTFSGNIVNAAAQIGIGTTTPAASFHLRINNGNVLAGNAGCNPGFVGLGFGANLSDCANYSLLGNGTDTMINRPAGGGLFFREGNTDQMSIVPGGNVGIGTTTPSARFHVSGNALVTGNLTVNGILTASLPANSSSYIQNRTTQQTSTNFNISGNDTVGGTLSGDIVNAATQYNVSGLRVLSMPNNTTIVLGSLNFTNEVVVPKLNINTLGVAGSTELCLNSSRQIAGCSSSIRYKSNVSFFNQGLSLIKRLRPVSFNWKADNASDFGLVAEEVAEVEPLLVTRNDKGEVEGVKYDRVSVVLVNAVQEQQRQIEAQQKQIDEQKSIIGRQRAELEALKKLVCSQNPAAEFCQPKK